MTHTSAAYEDTKDYTSQSNPDWLTSKLTARHNHVWHLIHPKRHTSSNEFPQITCRTLSQANYRPSEEVLKTINKMPYFLQKAKAKAKAKAKVTLKPIPHHAPPIGRQQNLNPNRPKSRLQSSLVCRDQQRHSYQRAARSASFYCDFNVANVKVLAITF